MSEEIVLDASAVLCLLKDEAGAASVKAALPRASISAVNLAEVVAKLEEAGGSAAQVTAILDALNLSVVPFDETQAVASGLLRAATKALGLSLGDRACLALARQQSATALTADRAWRSLPPDLGIGVELIR